MSATSRYYQFELCLLSLGTGTPAERLNVITSYCAIDVGWPLIQKMTKEERWAFVSAFTSKKPEGFDYKTATHIAILKGFEVLGMNGGVASKIVKEHAESIDHINKMFKLQGGASPTVRIRHDIMWDTVNGDGFDWRQFTVLCGVYSAIGGHKNPWQVTRDAIRARALGYKKESLLFDDLGKVTAEGEALLAKREDKARPITTNQVRWTLNQLEARGLFARCNVSARRTYFSNRMTAAEMREWFKANPPARTKLAKRLEADAKLRAEITPPKRPKKPKPYYSGDSYYSGESGGNSHHGVTTESPHDHHNVTASVTTSVTTKIETPNRSPLTEAPKHVSGAHVSDEERKKASEEFAKHARELIERGGV